MVLYDSRDTREWYRLKLCSTQPAQLYMAPLMSPDDHSRILSCNKVPGAGVH